MSERILDLGKYRCRTIASRGSGVPVVLLHGYSYTSAVWQRISLMGLLKEKHVPFLGLDMPYGGHSDCYPHSRNVETNVSVAREAIRDFFGSASPMLVGASLGAHIALQYAARFPVKCLLLVGAVRVFESRLAEAYNNFKFPVRLIIGSEDKIASEEDLRTLAGKLPYAKLTVYEGEGHSAYIGSPDRFKRDLLELYALAEQ